MELMATCLDKLLKKTKRPIPEQILGKMAVAVSILRSVSESNNSGAVGKGSVE